MPSICLGAGLTTLSRDADQPPQPPPVPVLRPIGPAGPVRSVTPPRGGGPSRPTLRDVAAAADVSLKTASRVVNDEPGVQDTTATRVRDAVVALGFRRNELARTLRRRAGATTLGLVIEDVANPFYSAIARAVEEVARAHGLLVVIGSSDEDPDRERALVTALVERRVDALLVVPAGDDHRYLLAERALGTPMIFLDRPPGRIDADHLVIDNVGGARAGATHLLEGGHRRVAFVSDSLRVRTAAERLDGYRQALAAGAVAVDESLVRLGSHDVASAEAAVRELLALAEPPTAILASNNRNSIGALLALRDHVRTAPPALVGFDDFELAGLVSPAVTVIAHEPAEMGRQAAELAIARLGGDDGPPRRIVLPTRLIVRGSGELRP